MGPSIRFKAAPSAFSPRQDEANRFNTIHWVEHLLLGLIREGEGVAARVLTRRVDLQGASSVESIIGRGDATTSPSEIKALATYQR